MFGFLLEGRRANTAGADNAAPLKVMNCLRFIVLLSRYVMVARRRVLSRPKTNEAIAICARAMLLLLSLLHLLAEFARAVHRVAGSKVVQLEKLADLDFTFLTLAMRSGNPFSPFDRLFPGLHLNDPVSGDQFLSLGEGAINNGALASGKLDARAFGTGLEAGEVEQHAGLHQLLVVFAHRGKNLFARHNARFRILTGLHNHHESHDHFSFRGISNEREKNRRIRHEKAGTALTGLPPPDHAVSG